MAITEEKDFLKKVSKYNTDWSKKNKITDKEYKRINVASDLPSAKIISTGNPALDWALGGGVPEGTIVEWYGQPGAGKSTTAAYMMKQIIDAGRLVLYYNTEENKKPETAFKLAGVDESKVIYIDPVICGEDGLNALLKLVLDENGMPEPILGMIVIDSVASLLPNAEVIQADKDGLEAPNMARHGAMISKMFRNMAGGGWLAHGCIISLVNQERAQIGSTPMPNISTGGNSIKYYPKLRVQLKAPKDGLLMDEEKNIVGHTVEFFVSKNNTGYGFPYKRGSWRVRYGKGIDYITPVVDEAIEYGVIQSFPGARFILRYFEDHELKKTDKLHGKTNLMSYIEANPEVIESLQDIISRVRTYIQENPNLRFYEGTAYDGNVEIDIMEHIVSTLDTKDEVTLSQV